MSVVFAVAREAMTTRVPALLLQPIVENAVQHGVAAVSRPVTIGITAERRGGTLVIGVTDDGPGPSGEWRDGVGLATTRGLLRAIYGEDARLEAAGQAGFAVTMTLPVW
jgi:LytS/YehU family sensor histidine kinase